MLRLATSDDGNGSRLSAASTWLACVTLFAYGIALPLLAVAETSGEPAALILLCIAVYSGSRIAIEQLLGARRWLVLTLHTFSFVFLGVAPLLQLGSGTLYWAATADEGVLLEAALVCAAGILAFDAGVVLTSGRSRVSRGVDQVAERAPSAAGVSDRALVVLSVFTAISIAIFVGLGGAPVVLASRDEMLATMCSSADLASCGIVSAIVRVPPAILAIAALAASNLERRPVRWVALLLGLAGLFLTANPVSTARFWFGAVGVGVLGMAIARRPIARVAMWFVFPAVILLLFPVMDIGRAAGWTPQLRLAPSSIVEKQDFDAFQQVVNGVMYVDTFGNRDGAQLTGALLFFVPRSVWPDKAIPTGTLVAGSFGFFNTNVSAPLWEEGYVDFGLAGVIALLFGLGTAVGIVEARSGTWWNSASAPVVFLPLVAGYGIYLLRGSLLAVMGTFAAVTLLIWITSRLSGRPSGSLPVVDRSVYEQPST